MLSDVDYSYVKVLYELNRTLWYVKKHAIEDSEKANHPLSVVMFNELAQDLEKHVAKLRGAIEGLSKEGKFD